MGLFDKLKKFLFGPFKPSRKKRSKKKRSKRRASSPVRKKSGTSTKTVRKAPSQKPRTPRPLPKKKLLAGKTLKPALKPVVLKKTSKGSASKPALKKTAPKAGKILKSVPESPGIYLGAITHYFAKVQAAVIPLEETLKVGDKIVIHNAAGPLFKQPVKSIQINRIPIDEGRPGEEVGLEVLKHVSVGDKVYRLKASR